MADNQSIVEQAVSEGGTYEVIHSRLIKQGKELSKQVQAINAERQQEFGSTEMSVIGRLRLRTEHNCVARDLVRVGDYLLFGYNVFIGLKKETAVTDVFGLYRLKGDQDNLDIEAVPIEKSFLNDQSFLNDFRELYSYYKNTRLTQLVTKNGKLLAAFQIGDQLSDQRVFRWNLSATGDLQYIDNRGERDIELPPKFDFEWQTVDRDQIVLGRHAHYSVQDSLFVDCLNGALTIKVENNTDSGEGIYSEPVQETNQSLDDLELEFVELGQLLLLKIKPYLEESFRYLVFNKQTEKVVRLDAIGESCVQLPEDHGIVFPGGYYLATGAHKTFDDDYSGFVYKRQFKSPNGEDVLFLFYEPNDGKVALLNYNLIEKELSNPIFGHGYGFFENGHLAIFYAETEATRVHPLQVWETPYFSDEFASQQPLKTSFFGKLGNAELVRGISEIYGIVRMINEANVSASHFNLLSKSCGKIFDSYYWLDSDKLSETAALIKQISETSELVLDEYEKVESIQKNSKEALSQAEVSQKEIIKSSHPDGWRSPGDFVQGLQKIRQQRGHLMSLKELRYMDVARLDELDQQLADAENRLNGQTVEFLSGDDALAHYQKDMQGLVSGADSVSKVSDLEPLLEKINSIAEGLDLLSELMATLKVADATKQTAIVESISEFYGKLNQQKARLQQKRKSLGSAEATAQFGAQFKLLGQSVQSALSLSTSPEKCDEQLARLLVQLEELESQFSEHDEFLTDILGKRDEIYEAFETQKQQLLEARQRKAQNIFDAASRIIESVNRRTSGFKTEDELNTFFASDALILKLNQLSQELRELDEVVKADDLEAKVKALKDQAIRTLRDKSDIFEEGGKVIKLGPRHRFSVNTTELDLTLIPRSGVQHIHLTGTDYYEAIEDESLSQLSNLWDQNLSSESETVYRSEYLAFLILQTSQGKLPSAKSVGWDELTQAIENPEALLDLVRDFASDRYREGYEKGIHDQDAANILKILVQLLEQAGPLRFSALARSLAVVFWVNHQRSEVCEHWPERARTAYQLSSVFGDRTSLNNVEAEVSQQLMEFNESWALKVPLVKIKQAAEYLVLELSAEHHQFVTTKYARKLVNDFQTELNVQNVWRDYQTALEKQKGHVGNRWRLTNSWLQGFVKHKNLVELESFIPEAVSILNADARVDRQDTEADLQATVVGMYGDHSQLDNGQYQLQLDEYLERLSAFHLETVPRWYKLQDVRQSLVEQYREDLRLDEYKARPLSSFVRNKLINEVYLPMIGDNLAKQMGTAGENKRTDLMGLLLLISPPGYGKTTLMEYVANRLGLVFMKINCPSIGHQADSVDPSQATNSAARQELEKLNLALEMGSNVMLYLDDIQHTNPEFLQKFISLCDGTRRMEGVWKGDSKTYDMRGKKFCIVMAGNPYTESGELFRIPDMLANRADIYNLGDVIGGKQDTFGLSFIENSLTSNSVLAPLATRGMDDVYSLIKMAETDQIAANELKHNYSGAEVQEIVSVLQKMFVIRDVILKVNQQYIESSATAEKYRQEPAFKLQGSYRNMNKMAEKLSSVMTQDELMQLVSDHYQGEAQLLTQGAEENLLKLAQLRGNMTEVQSQRWQQILDDFSRNKAMGGDDTDAATKVVAQLVDLVAATKALAGSDEPQSSQGESARLVATQIAKLARVIQNQSRETNKPELDGNLVINKLDALMQREPNVTVVNEPVQGVDDVLKALINTLDESLLPLVKIMNGKINIDLNTHYKMNEIMEKLQALESSG